MSDLDRERYYTQSSDVKIEFETGKHHSGKIISVNLEKNFAIVKVRHGSEKAVLLDKILRIF